MHRAHYFVASMLLSTALIAPTAMTAAAKPQNAQVRVYDKDHKDYHNWDQNENKAWMRYQEEKHIKYHEFAKANAKEQSEYWDWRHSHPD